MGICRRGSCLKLLSGCLVLSAALCGVGCNAHPVSLSSSSGSIAVHQDRSVDSAAAVDILWVIDNSGSMCEEQAALRKNFKAFIDKITSQNIDFHIGVTTTQMKELFSPEPVAIPGQLQSTPQPVPSSFAACWGDPGDPNDQQDGFTPLRNTLDVAIACTKDPAKWQSLAGVSDDDIDCLLHKTCEGTPYDLFPKNSDGSSPYRDIPKVLSADDLRYQNPDGTINIDKLKADFSCMSLVGTRGFYYEKGLSAAVLAVSPQKTGGTGEHPIDYKDPDTGEVTKGADLPNHALLRDSANFALIFVSDENDCSHDGTLEEQTSCADAECEFADNPALGDKSPLIPIKGDNGLAQQFMDNLSASKGREVKKSEVVVSTITGAWRRYGAASDYPSSQPPPIETWTNGAPKAQCGKAMNHDNAKDIACGSPEFGTAYSGDRYDRFLRQFDRDRVFPKIPKEGEHIPGMICQPTQIPHTLESIGKTIAGSVSQCIFDVPYACTSDDECPQFYFGEGTPTCTPFGDGSGGTGYCNSGIQVRMSPGKDHTMDDLLNNDYCIPESVGSDLTPDGCVIKPSTYKFVPCPGAETQAIDLQWQETHYFEKLAGYKVDLVYTLQPQDGSNTGTGTGSGN